MPLSLGPNKQLSIVGTSVFWAGGLEEIDDNSGDYDSSVLDVGMGIVNLIL